MLGVQPVEEEGVSAAAVCGGGNAPQVTEKADDGVGGDGGTKGGGRCGVGSREGNRSGGGDFVEGLRVWAGLCIQRTVVTPEGRVTANDTKTVGNNDGSLTDWQHTPNQRGKGFCCVGFARQAPWKQYHQP